MIHLLATIAAAAVVFVGTDVDDLIVLTVLFLAGRATGRPTVGAAVAGQYLGIGALVGVSAAAAVGLLLIPDRWVGLLGLIPLCLGIRGLALAKGRAPIQRRPPARRRGDEPDQRVAATGVFSIAAVTIANGADNLSVYVPLFRTIGLADSVVTIATFAAMVAVWLAVAHRLGSYRKTVAAVERSGHWLVPVVFIVIGVVLIARALVF
jgi:cadmium resistance protein CadD (predicted permease)